MKNAFKSLALAFGVAALSASAMAQDSGPLLDALVKKGVLSDNEAEDIRVNLVKEYNSTSAGKLQISGFVKNLQLFGDARLRYQWQDVQTPRSGAPAGAIVDTVNDRYRYRLRVGANYTYDSHWSATVRLETGSQNDSANSDWGNYWSKNGTGDPIAVGQLYLTYKTKFEVFDSTSTVPDGKSFKTIHDPGLTIGSTTIIGRAPKTVLLSDAFFFGDLNPEGLTQEFTFDNVGIDGLSFALRGAGYLTTNEQSTAPNGPIHNTSVDGGDGGLFIAQFEGKYAFSTGILKGSNVRIAPLYLQESAGASQLAATNNATGVAEGGSTSGAGSIPSQGNLRVIALPAEFNWKSDVFGLFGKKLPQQIFGTYGANLAGNSRLAEMYASNGGAGPTPLHGNNTFWNAGYQIGQNKAKGDWSLKGEWRWIEAASYTTNLTDSNWAGGGANQQGFVVSAGYNLTDAVQVQGTWYHSNPIADSRGAGTINATPSANYGASTFFNQGQVDIVQADLLWKF
ncbi:putative porin [Verrucomicrobium sp. GAS474]|uniref:putative porin n=1 Tax=Verrucomicrobium sp. GAS474 TaxID=1882831 RepID=UPI0012FFCB09|nr:putative porin [Verrucomicrobium sp. GAS474]